MMEHIESMGLAKDSQGARIIEVAEETDDHEIPPLLLVKSNGSASYETTDLATILQRKKAGRTPCEVGGSPQTCCCFPA